MAGGGDDAQDGAHERMTLDCNSKHLTATVVFLTATEECILPLMRFRITPWDAKASGRKEILFNALPGGKRVKQDLLAPIMVRRSFEGATGRKEIFFNALPLGKLLK